MMWLLWWSLDFEKDGVWEGRECRGVVGDGLRKNMEESEEEKERNCVVLVMDERRW